MFVVVGGGPTGVELAGALGEIAFDTLKRDFRRIDPPTATIHLVEANDRVLVALPAVPVGVSAAAARASWASWSTPGPWSSAWATTGSSCARRPRRRPPLSRIRTRTVLWAAGRPGVVVRAGRGGRDGRRDGSSRAGGGGTDLTVPGHPEILVIGDAAVQPWKPDRPVPGVAQGAIQAGKYAAKAVRRRLAGEPVGAFRYQDRGDVAVIGRLAGVTNIGWLGPLGRQSGFFAWALWLTIHIAYLIGFSNRLVVLVRWAWSFITHGRGSRLITGQPLVPPLNDPDG